MFIFDEEAKVSMARLSKEGGVSPFGDIKKRYKTLGENLRAERKLRNLSFPEMAEYLGLSTSRVRKLELGMDRPSLETIYWLCAVLWITPNELLLPQEDNKIYKLDEAQAKMMTAIVDPLFGMSMPQLQTVLDYVVQLCIKEE